MPFLVRRVNSKARWDPERYAPWLPSGDAPSDLFAELISKDNRLSVWQIEDDHSNLDAVVTALATVRDSVGNVDYAILDLAHVQEIGITAEKCPGDSPDQLANETWHRDLVKLTGSKLCRLAALMMNPAILNRRTEREVGRLIAQAIKEKRMAMEKLPNRLQQSVSRYLN